ncbi:MAG: hypothetical protein QMD25_06710, partial [Caldisericia bacterium]|nr:hypothetical protein [Caldisericia bacterium]
MKKEKRKTFLRILISILIVICIIFLFGLIYVYRIYNQYAATLPEIKDIQYEPPQSSEIYDREGNLIKVVFFSENRIF